MQVYPIRVEAVEVRTESDVGLGMAKTQQGETHILTGRAPEGGDMCASSFNPIYPMAMALRLTEKMDWEKVGFDEMPCPHGKVTWRLSRASETE